MRNGSIAALLFFMAPVPALTAQEYQSHFPPEEFKARREKVFDRIGPDAVAVLQGAHEPGGFVYPRQDSVFYYLRGVENPHSYLLLDGRSRKATLYLSPRGIGRGERVLSVEKPDLARQWTGVDEALPAEKLALPRVNVIYTMFSPAEGQGQSRGELLARNAKILADPWDGRVSREANFVSLLVARHPRAEIRKAWPCTMSGITLRPR